MNPDDAFRHTGSIIPLDLGLHLISRLCVPGNSAILEAFDCVSKFAGAIAVWLSTGAGSNFKRCGGLNGSGRPSTRIKDATSCAKDIVGSDIGFCKKLRSSSVPVFFKRATVLSVREFLKAFGHLHSHPVLSLAAALVPPIDNLSSKVLALPLENSHESIGRLVGRTSSGNDYQGCCSFSVSPTCWVKDSVEPMTGIAFPTFLENGFGGENNFRQSTEILVGTGARSMRIMKFKSLKIYAFGLYVQSDSICEQLGSKYASVPVNDLKDQPEFFEDLLRADIHMTVRLVVNCNGIKITAVKDAFEKSLRARLEKMNPETDYHCLNTFGSYFTRDIPLPVGTTIDFRKTADGKLITEIGGKHIGSVQSKELCRAFFDMYIGEVPVSAKAKQEVAENVAGLIRRC